jgi:hypothetical protein
MLIHDRLASDVKSMNLGAAVAASMPKIKITITNSINVKPLDKFISYL